MTAVGTHNQATREAWLETALQAIPSGSRILDAGAGEGRYRPLCAHLDYVGQDLAGYDGRGDGEALHAGSWDCSGVDIVSDITAIPEADASFDAVMCIEVLEHVPNPVEALRELARLLRSGGTLIVTAPFCALTHQSPYFFQTGFSRYYYEHWLEWLGVEVEEITLNGNYFEYLGQELRRLPAIAERYAGAKMPREAIQEIEAVIQRLGLLSVQDQGSAELLAFGLHVRGRKR
ncbi:MAG: class I SAM-dependent methyltransferase [Phycisphaerae bacterium]|nr:class I SAM-dependent methyltransferase [Phycisphaerae bacterium]